MHVHHLRLHKLPAFHNAFTTNTSTKSRMYPAVIFFPAEPGSLTRCSHLSARVSLMSGNENCHPQLQYLSARRTRTRITVHCRLRAPVQLTIFCGCPPRNALMFC